MKRISTYILWLVGVAILLSVTAHLTLRHALNTPKFKQAATGFIQRLTGRAADYGRIDYSLHPVALVVRDASLQEPDAARDFASCRECSILIDLESKEISALRLVQPFLRIEQRPDGSFNFSDLLPPPAPPSPAPGPADASAPPSPTAPPPPAAPPTPFSIPLVEIEDARVEFTRIDADGTQTALTLSHLDFHLRDFSPGRPFQMEGRALLGKTSTAQFTLSGPAPADYAARIGEWPISLQSRLDIPDFADLQAFLPDAAGPIQSLTASLSLQGALADAWTVQLDLATPDPSPTHPCGFQASLRATLSLPAPVAQHLLAGAPLPESLRSAPPPGNLPPAAALFLQRAQATASLVAPRIAYGQNVFENAEATAHLRDGVLTIPSARLAAYGGTLEARANAQLLACPPAYRLDRLSAHDLAIEQALAANAAADLLPFSGRLQLEASAEITAFAGPGLRDLKADASARILDLRSVGAGGSLMDQAWLRLDHPLLLTLLPPLADKVSHARQAAASITTSRYDEATASLSLRDGAATLSHTRLSSSGYRLDLSGRILPFDDRLDLAAALTASPEESARLTQGRDLSALLPTVDGGLSIPLSIQGPLRSPDVRPDLDRLFPNAPSGASDAPADAPASPLDALSRSDRQHVEQGLRLLGTLLRP